MPNWFPPQSVYPTAIDNDYTLFKVHNSAEAALTENNSPFAEEIAIQPASGAEVWGENGYANIGGELVYYDAVGKNADGKVNSLKRVLRNQGGSPPQHNPAGSTARGTVVAQHHDQISNAIGQLQSFTGTDSDEDSLGGRVRQLANTPPITDDSAPTMGLDFDILSSDPISGTIARYAMDASGDSGNFKLNFGDGTSTTTASGLHQYPPGATIDPLLIANNRLSESVQSAVERDTADNPETEDEVPPFYILVPILPEFPSLIFPSLGIPSSDLFIPPIILPEIDLTDTTLSLKPIDIKSMPAVAMQGCCDSSISGMPSVISVIDSLPHTININPIPAVSVDWGTPPAISCQCQIVCPTETPAAMHAGLDGLGFGPSPNDIAVEYETVGFPTEIKIIAPELPDIQVRHNLPTEIQLLPPQNNDWLQVINLSHTVTLEAPTGVQLTWPTDIPVISIDASSIPSTIRVEGIPDIIQVQMPSVIDVRMPERIPLVFDGPPISTEVKITFDLQKLIGEGGDYPCVALVPCSSARPNI